MKRWIVLSALLCVAVTVCRAQDDDVYFVPSGVKSEPAKKVSPARYAPVSSEKEYADDWASGRVGERDVDDYNRRGTAYRDTLNSGEELPEETESGVYTARLVRFHSPRVGIYVSSPFYVDYYDYWLDPWYDSWYCGWWPGYSVGWWYGWGWRPYWHSWWGWHDPWWGPSWGWHHPIWSTPSWSVNHRPSRYMATNRLTSYRPSRDYAASRGNGSGLNRGTTTRPSRGYTTGTSGRPSRQFGTSRSTNRNISTPTQPRSRSIDNSSNRSNRSYGTPSNSSSGRSFGTGSGSGRSIGSGNHGFGGSGRSVGGGGGRSFGGRR